MSVPKRISTTRWSCWSDATKALVQGYAPICQALAKVGSEDEMRSEANGLHERMYKLETASTLFSGMLFLAELMPQHCKIQNWI